MPLLGISSSMVGGCSIFVEDVDATDEELDELLCAFKTSSTGTSMVVNTGESGGPLDKLTGVCIDDVEDSSSPGASSCGLETVGVMEGDTNTVADKGTVASTNEQTTLKRNLSPYALIRTFSSTGSSTVCQALPSHITYPLFMLSITTSLIRCLHILQILRQNLLLSNFTHPKIERQRLTAIGPISTSEPELISADTLLNKRANVTFFSNLGSLRMTRSMVAEVKEPVFSEKVVSFTSLSESTLEEARIRLSDKDINSPKLTLGLAWAAAGETNCCRICFFSAAFFLTGVELLRFLRGEGEPTSHS
uniref:Uncharacterized protein n=1 Tax=Glossina pallidipes TaxID=7398 RepID=A0A1A9ZK12_GLOPL